MEKGGERGLRRSSTFVTSGDFSPKASNKAQRAIIDERHFDRRKAFLNAKGLSRWRKECGTRDAKSVRAVCARRTDPHATRGKARERAPCARRFPAEEARGRSARREEVEKRARALGVRRVGLPRCGDKSSEPRLNLSGSWQQGHSAAYNTPFLIQVVCK